MTANMRTSFCDEQLLAFKVAQGINLIPGLSFAGFAVVARTLPLGHPVARVLAGALVLSLLVGVFVVYILKSSLGVDLVPGFSFGVWGWFQEAVLAVLLVLLLLGTQMPGAWRDEAFRV